MKLNVCFWSRTAKEKRNCQKKEDRPLDLIQHFPGEYGDRERQDQQQQHNFCNVYLLFISEYWELIHRLNELNIAYYCSWKQPEENKQTNKKKGRNWTLTISALCLWLPTSSRTWDSWAFKIQGEKKKRKLSLGYNFGSLVRPPSPQK